MRRSAAAAAALALAAGCGSSDSASPNEAFRRGVEQIHASHSATKLHERLRRTLVSLRQRQATTQAGRTARRLAIQGFAATLQGVDAQIDLLENDSGNLEAAVRDAAKADRYRSKGANLLRAAGRVLGVRVGKLGGY